MEAARRTKLIARSKQLSAKSQRSFARSHRKMAKATEELKGYNAMTMSSNRTNNNNSIVADMATRKYERSSQLRRESNKAEQQGRWQAKKAKAAAISAK